MPLRALKRTILVLALVHVSAEASAKSAELMHAQAKLQAARASKRALTDILSPLWGKGPGGARDKWRAFRRTGQLTLDAEASPALLRSYRAIAKALLSNPRGDVSVVRYRARLAKAALKRLAKRPVTR